MVGHAGTRWLTDIAEATGLVEGFAEALRGCGAGSVVTNGRVAVDVAVVLADGGQASAAIPQFTLA